jgi:hypothetical protein
VSGEIFKTPQVIRDLTDTFVFLGEESLFVADRFLHATDDTFQ